MFAYMDLVEELNEALNDNGGEGDFTVNSYTLQKPMDDLRSALLGIICTYDPENPDFADVSLQFPKAIPLLNEEDE